MASRGASSILRLPGRRCGSINCWAFLASRQHHAHLICVQRLSSCPKEALPPCWLCLVGSVEKERAGEKAPIRAPRGSISQLSVTLVPFLLNAFLLTYLSFFFPLFKYLFKRKQEKSCYNWSFVVNDESRPRWWTFWNVHPCTTPNRLICLLGKWANLEAETQGLPLLPRDLHGCPAPADPGGLLIPDFPVHPLEFPCGRIRLNHQPEEGVPLTRRVRFLVQGCGPRRGHRGKECAVYRGCLWAKTPTGRGCWRGTSLKCGSFSRNGVKLLGTYGWR